MVDPVIARGSAEQALLTEESLKSTLLSAAPGSPSATVSPTMRSPEPAFDAASLKRVEQVYRKQLTDDPADPVARISLAWCLFMQALLRAGQESVLEALVERSEGPDESVDTTRRTIVDQNAAELLEDCLRQTMTVKQLSADPAAHLGAERLLALVKLSGGDSALNAAEEEAARILNEVTREVLGRQEPGKGGLRRLPTRRPAP